MLQLRGPDRFCVPRGESTAPDTWSPPPRPVAVPTGGVTVREGSLFHATMRENISYLLRSFSADHMLYHFRKRAGHADPPGGETQVSFWDTNLEGSSAGRFLMGAGNTLRWIEDGELRGRMDAIVDGWIAKIVARDPEAIWIHGLGMPHCYEITAMEAYMDHYLATGDGRYLEAMEGAWEMIHRHWQHAGGSIAICEGHDYPPDSRFIDRKKHTGEFCGSVFWAKLGQRFHMLRPEEERYVAEIEKAIYNVALANQAPGAGIRYHAHLEGHKARALEINTCCEGQGTRFLGSLPEYIYSIADDGLYVNLFAASTIEWNGIELKQETDFPFDGEISLTIASPGARRASAASAGIRIRVPGWAAADVEFSVNGKVIATGKPGSYVTIEREWSDGDTIQFELPMELRLTLYRGADNFDWHIRFAIEYGPILMAVVGPPRDNIPVYLAEEPGKFPDWLEPIPGEPLHWRVRTLPEYRVVPYWELGGDQHFSCYPVLTGEEQVSRAQPKE